MYLINIIYSKRREKMNKNARKKYISTVIIFSFVLIYANLETGNTFLTEDFQTEYIFNAASPLAVEIYDDVDLAAASSSGDGSLSLPYVIEDLHIDTGGLFGLLIIDTTKHFVVENCTIRSSIGYGIYLSNVSYGTYHLRNNTVHDCNSYGIAIYDSGGGFLEDNIIINNANGIDITDCPNTIITDNLCQNRNAGIFVRHSKGTTVNNNQMYGDGLEIIDDKLSDYLSLDCSNNFVNDKPILYGENLTSYVEADYGQIILVNCSDFIFWDLEIYDVDEAVVLFYCSYVSFYYGIIAGTDNCIIQFNCEWCWVVDCTFNDYSTGVFCDNSSYNSFAGSYYGDGSDGILLSYCNSTTIRENTFYNNSQTGVYLEYCNYIYVHHNNFIENGNVTGYQAFDEMGSNTWWYEFATSEGNYWSDLGNADNYTIEGSPTKYDLYPLDSPYVPIPEFSQANFVYLILAFFIFSTIIAIPIFKRRKK
jgi:parallel beta-helix repeat protein